MLADFASKDVEAYLAPTNHSCSDFDMHEVLYAEPTARNEPKLLSNIDER